MEPLVEGTAAPGNVGRNIPAVKQQVRERIRTIISERSTVVDVVVTPHQRIPALDSYPAAIGGARLTAEELDAANAALVAGATHLLVATVLEWTVMRTDDPLSARSSCPTIKLSSTFGSCACSRRRSWAMSSSRSGRASRSISRR